MFAVATPICAVACMQQRRILRARPAAARRISTARSPADPAGGSSESRLERSAGVVGGHRAHVGRQQIALLRELAAQRAAGVASVLCRVACCSRTSVREAPPAVTRRCVMSSCLCCARAMSSVAAICARSEASVIAAVTTLAVRRQIAGLQRELCIFGLGLQRLDLAADAAERVERVRHVHRGAVQGIVETRPDSGEGRMPSGPSISPLGFVWCPRHSDRSCRVRAATFSLAWRNAACAASSVGLCLSARSMSALSSGD